MKYQNSFQINENTYFRKKHVFSKQILTPAAAHVNYNIQIKVKKSVQRSTNSIKNLQKKLQIASLFTETSKFKMAKIILMNCKL